MPICQQRTDESSEYQHSDRTGSTLTNTTYSGLNLNAKAFKPNQQFLGKRKCVNGLASLGPVPQPIFKITHHPRVEGLPTLPIHENFSHCESEKAFDSMSVSWKSDVRTFDQNPVLTPRTNQT